MLRETLPRQLDTKNKNAFVGLVQRIGEVIEVPPIHVVKAAEEILEWGAGTVAPADDYLASWTFFRAFNFDKSQGAAQWWGELETQSMVRFGPTGRHEIVWALFTIWRGNLWAEATTNDRPPSSGPGAMLV
jgi:hypothetical protein